jgi:glycosyltransferase involved in cell wall biosynthesis
VTGRILLITKTDYTDPRDGGTLRVSSIVRELTAAGFVVDAVPTKSSAGRSRDATGRRDWGAIARVALASIRIGSLTVARWFSAGAASEIAQLTSSHVYDAVVIEYSQLLIYRPLVKKYPILLDMHNIEFELLANFAASGGSFPKRVIARYEAARVRRLETRGALRLVDAITTVSGHDADLLTELTGIDPSRISTAPNGVSTEAFELDKLPERVPTAVFIAHLGWQPNVDAAHWLAEQVWPAVRVAVPDARLELIGRSPARSVRAFDGIDGITVHADVPSTMPYLARAAAATAPLLAAGGTRLKILEAMATGTPVVATGLGAMGLEHLAGSGGLVIEDSAADYAAALAATMSAPAAPEGIRDSVRSYRWDAALAPLIAALRAIIAGRESR